MFNRKKQPEMVKVKTGDEKLDIGTHLLPANTVIELAPEYAARAIQAGAEEVPAEPEPAAEPKKKRKRTATDKAAENRETATDE